MGWENTKEKLNIIKFAEGTSTEGVFKRRLTIESKEVDKKTGELKKYEAIEILNPEDELEHIFLSGSLEYQLEGVNEGDKIKITYNGKVESEKSPVGFFHDYTVQKWVE